MNQQLTVVVLPTGSLHLEWKDTTEALSKSSKLLQQEIHSRFTAQADSWLLFLGFCDHQVPLSPSLTFWRNFTGLYTWKLSQTPDLDVLRHRVTVELTDDDLTEALDELPLMTGSEYVSPDLLRNVWLTTHQEFVRSIKGYDGTVAKFIQTYSPHVHLIGRVFFHLVENKNSDVPFAFLATYSSRLNKEGKTKHLPLRYALQEYGEDSNKLLDLLTTVYAAAGQSTLIADLIETGELFHPLAWSSSEAFTFLTEIPLYEASGILCRIPNWWKGNTARVRLNINIGDKQPSFVGMDALLNVDTQLLLGDTVLSESEARHLLEQSEGLAFIKNKWVAVDREKLQQTLEAYEKARRMVGKKGLTIQEALRLQLNPEKIIGLSAEDEEPTVSNGQWMTSVIQRLGNVEHIDPALPGKGFRAKLRDYQQKGVNWLHFLHSLRFGACLADDMGLGKTVQLLGFLNTIKADKPDKSSLLVIPASLIANWVNEIERFYPNLNYRIAHPSASPEESVQGGSERELDSFDLVITTYTLVQKYEWLQTYDWNYVILDEAQAIKNPATKQTRAIKKLTARNRIVMTGTPIENRLADLWSLFDFLNPGLLGNKSEFGKFSKALKQNSHGYARLRKIITPYILRRLKTDKSVIADLPDKVEMKTYAPLSKKQVALYGNMIDELKRILDESDGIQRRGLILASLMKFKQLCNHPDQYLGGAEFDEKHSGKFARLREICETIYEKRERVLVFTQFKEMTEPLALYLENIFERKGLVLHGSIPVKKRKTIIEQFQSDDYVPFMVLSLKVGGVGLNF